MQIDPNQQVGMVLNTIDGSQLELEPGRSVVARVVTGTDGGGSARISLAGQMLDVSSAQPLEAGQTIRLTVQSTSTHELRLALMQEPPPAPPGSTNPPIASDAGRANRPADIAPRGVPASGTPPMRDAVIVPASAGAQPAATPDSHVAGSTPPQQGVPGVSASPTTPGVSQSSSSDRVDLRPATMQPAAASKPTASDEPAAIPTAASRPATNIREAAMRELVRAGVPATQDMVRAATRAIESLMRSDTPAVSDTGTASRVVANLAARALPVSDAVATRVAAALDMAGRVGAQLQELARVDGRIAGALPSDSPSAAALRGLMSSSIPPAELAIARIAQAQVAASQAQATAPGAAPVALPEPTASPQVVSNFIASQLARAASLDELASSASSSAGQQASAGGSQHLPMPEADVRSRQATVQGTASQPQAAQPQAAQPQAAQPQGATPLTGSQLARASTPTTSPQVAQATAPPGSQRRAGARLHANSWTDTCCGCICSPAGRS